MSKITNAQWYLLKDHLDSEFFEVPWNVSKATIKSLVKNKLLSPISPHGRRYRITNEAKVAIDNMNRLTERYDRS